MSNLINRCKCSFIPIKQITSLGGTNVSFVANSQTSYGFAVNQRFYLQNFLSELDAPGEYYIDRNNSKIYFWPTSTDYTQNDFIVSTTNNVLTLTNVAYFTLQGLTIEASRKDVIIITAQKLPKSNSFLIRALSDPTSET